jgi:hypothetical protein
MKKDKKTPDTKDQKSTKATLTRTLPCKLSEKELAKAGKDLADNMDKIEGIEQQKKTADDGFKKDIGLLEEVTTALRGMLKSGAQEREVKCEQVTDYRNGEVRVKRLDTGDVFERRTMHKDEYQLPLEAQKPAGKLLAMDGGKGKDGDAAGGAADAGGEATVGEPALKAPLGETAAANAKKKGKKGEPEIDPDTGKPLAF